MTQESVDPLHFQREQRQKWNARDEKHYDVAAAERSHDTMRVESQGFKRVRSSYDSFSREKTANIYAFTNQKFSKMYK